MKRFRRLAFMLILTLLFQTVLFPCVSPVSVRAADEQPPQEAETDLPDTPEEGTETPGEETEAPDGTGSQGPDVPGTGDPENPGGDVPGGGDPENDGSDVPGDAESGTDGETPDGEYGGSPQEEQETDPPTGDDAQTEETALPDGIAGMPEGYELTVREKAMKQAVLSDDVAGELAQLTEGVDYATRQVLCAADSAEHAALIAGAYNGTLLDYGYGIATILLDGESLSVAEAVEAGADAGINIPAVEPNYIIPEEEPVADTRDDRKALNPQANVPVRQTWQSGQDGGLFNDPALTDPLKRSYQWMHDLINSYAAWGVTTGKRDVTVAVIDTGVMASHAEFGGRVSTPDIGLLQYDFNNNRYTTTPIGTDDYDGHGTHVAGIIAAGINNGTGGAGVAPGVAILSIRTGQTTQGGHYVNNVIKAVRFAAGYNPENGLWSGTRRADIINMSLGFGRKVELFQDAITDAYRAGVTVCASMGNDAANKLNYPAAYDHVIAVCSVNESGAISEFSNYGAWADIAAPGTNIYSTGNNGGYLIMGGTSMACPVVAGACALYMSAYGHVDPDTMETVLKRSVNKSISAQTGAGIIDVSKMFGTDNTPPGITVTATRDTVAGAAGGMTVTVNGSVATDAVIRVNAASMNGRAGENGVIIYTTNGKNPSVLNGQTVNGELYTGPIPVTDIVGTTLSGKKVISFRAACVSGIGVLSRPTILNITVDPAKPSSVKIGGAPVKLVAGKSVTLSALIEPAAASKKVTWEIDRANSSASLAGAVVSAGGKITTKVGQTGKLAVRAVSAVDASVTDTVEITVIDEKPVGTIRLDKTGGTLAVSANLPAQPLEISVSALTDTAGADKEAESASLAWSSSNTKVATVAAVDGTHGKRAQVTPVAKGSCVITVKALDGSGKSAACKVTVAQLAERTEVTGQGSVAPGNSATYKATVMPAGANVKTVTWSLTSDPEGNMPLSVPGITIDEKKGTLKIDPNVAEGTSFYVCATATDSGKQTGTRLVYVREKTASVRILHGTEAVSAKTVFVQDEITLEAETDNGTTPLWSTSNPKVAKAAADPVSGAVTVTAVGKGTAKITCAAQDGSGKKAVLTLTVLQPVESIEVTGQKYIAQGTSATFRVSKLLPVGASKKNVNWFVSSVSGVSVSNKGVVKVESAVPEGQTITVTAEAADGSGVIGTTTFTVTKAKTAKVVISSADLKTHNLAKTDRNGNLTAVQLFTVNAGKDSTDETILALDADLFLADGSYLPSSPVWTSSKESVVTFAGAREGNSVFIRAVSKGSAKITCAAQDGSGKKAVITVNVVVPVSGLTLTPKNGQETYISLGKSATLTPVAGSLYGTPGNAKVTWDYDIILWKDDYVGGAYAGTSTTVCANNDFLKRNRFAAVSNGKVTAPSVSTYDKYWNYYGLDSGDWEGIGISVTARTTDGSNITAVYDMYRLVDQTNRISTISSRTIYAGESWSYGLYAQTKYSYKYRGRVYYYYANNGMNDFSVVSSNPKVASGYTGYNSNGAFGLIVTAYAKGKTTLTITARDGSNCKTRVTIIVK